MSAANEGQLHRLVRKSRKPLTEAEKKKRKAAADSLCGIWADLPKRVKNELMKKSYP